MESSEYWCRIVAANPGLADESAFMKISVKSLRRQVEKAFQEGADSQESAPSSSPFDSLGPLADIFGFGKKGKK